MFIFLNLSLLFIHGYLLAEGGVNNSDSIIQLCGYVKRKCFINIAIIILWILSTISTSNFMLLLMGFDRKVYFKIMAPD